MPQLRQLGVADLDQPSKQSSKREGSSESIKVLANMSKEKEENERQLEAIRRIFKNGVWGDVSDTAPSTSKETRFKY